MHEPLDFSAYARQVRSTAKALMGSGLSARSISAHVHLLAVAAERDLRRFADSHQLARIACRPGCGACCMVNVAVLFPEAVAITRFLKRRLTAERLGKLKDRLRELLVRTKGLDDEERLLAYEPCAFLDRRGSCSIHAVRPLMCRSITSADSNACREAIAMTPLDGPPSIAMHLFQKQLFDTVYCSVGEALEELGLDHRPMRLAAAVEALLADPALVALYAEGERLPRQ